MSNDSFKISDFYSYFKLKTDIIRFLGGVVFSEKTVGSCLYSEDKD